MKKIDDEHYKKLLRHGRALIVNYSILVRLTGVYDSMNEAIVNSSAKVLKELEALIGEDGELALRTGGGSFYIDEVRIKPATSDVDSFAYLARELDHRKIGVITFNAPLQTDDIVFLAYTIKGGGEAADIQSVLEKRLTKGLTVGGPLSFSMDSSLDMKDNRKLSRRAYTKALTAFKDINDSIRTGRKLNVKRAKRAFQSIVDSITKDEGYVLGLTTIRDTKNYYFNHSVNVAILSIALGMRVSLSKFHLTRIGMAALLHDIGKVEVPWDILNKTKEFSVKEMELMELHPLDGVKQILKTWGLNDLSIISMLAAYEHHVNKDHSGYPKVAVRRRPIIFSRIIKIADDFDSLVSGRVYGRNPMSPEEALSIMYENRDTIYDVPLLKAFIDIFSRR